MIMTPAVAIALLPKLLDLGLKIADIIKSGNAQDVTDEIAALERARLLPSAEIIARADAQESQR